MSKLTPVLVLSAVISLGGALRCYQCVQPTGKSCDITIECSLMCGNYILKYTNHEMLYQGCYVDKQCELVENIYANNPAVSVKNCRMCETDLCNNSSPKIQNVTLLVIGILGFYFIL
ncbi:hypothetical protein TcasGA2_TC034065 [Tribolium castaneum]|uniref:Protein quiver n=1 Tax=Tribolium castaneum TaxID=7070 RepID=A0A139WD50_TRICA|nr:PREDICTED: CD59 glycoprotein-like [Tribolium castaneum]KYB25832.1 hypothetical protein TcasGA2_TC034065 [Tribolium castaneum]|eukprot:XP_008196821.1 PREDICTED: CD59 glycoprotein-like [Tribolium castaneum]